MTFSTVEMTGSLTLEHKNRQLEYPSEARPSVQVKRVFIKGANFSLKFSQSREDASKAAAFVCNGTWCRDPQPALVPGGVRTWTTQHGARTEQSFWRRGAVSLQHCPQANHLQLMPLHGQICAPGHPNTTHERDKIMQVTISFGNKTKPTFYFSNPSPAPLPSWRPIFLGHLYESLGPSKLLTDFSGGKNCL